MRVKGVMESEGKEKKTREVGKKNSKYERKYKKQEIYKSIKKRLMCRELWKMRRKGKCGRNNKYKRYCGN